MQLTTDGLHAYLVATDSAFGTDIDSARLIGVHGSGPSRALLRPPVCISSKTEIASGSPDVSLISSRTDIDSAVRELAGHDARQGRTYGWQLHASRSP